MVENHGYEMRRSVLDETRLEHLRCLLGEAQGAGTRGILALPEIAHLAETVLADLVYPHLPAPPVAVRGIYFDKRPGANWSVAWHQDLTLAVAEPHEVSGFGPWSIKDGVAHVQPPASCLEQMLTARLHLDDADESNGALRVIPGSHRLGRLDSNSIRESRDTITEEICTAKAGDVLLMRPLLLHASSRASSPSRRRVIHIEFAGFDLPQPLRWSEGPCNAALPG